jgi:NitT/TauT family transport system permease protein
VTIDAEVDTPTTDGTRARTLRGIVRSAGTNALVQSLVVTVAVWWVLSEWFFIFLPTPLEVGVAFVEAVTSAEFYADLAVTLRRVVLAWIGAMIIAVVLGIAMGRSWLIEAIAHPWVFVSLALPGPLVVLFSILAFGLGELTTMVALLIVVTPFVVTFVYDATRALDSRLDQMSIVYQMAAMDRVRHVFLPQMAPALMAGARFGFAISWKLVVLVEALSSNVGIGERIQFFFVFNDPANVIAWTLTFTVVMVIVEVFGFQALDRRLFAWRPEAPHLFKT